MPEDVSKEDFKVVQKDDLYNSYDIDKLSAEDGKVQLKLNNNLEDGETYQVVYDGKESQTVDFSYEKATPTAVNITTDKVAADSGNVQLESEVLADDLDVTEDFNVKYSSDETFVNEDGIVNTSNLEGGDTFLVRATVGSGKDAVTSDLRVVVAEDSMANSYQFTNVQNDTDINSDLDEEDATTTLDTGSTGSYIVPYVEDQFGDLVDNDDFHFESLDPETLLVDENTGEVLGSYDKGTAKVKITAEGTNFEKVVSVDVKEPAEIDSFELSETDIDMVDTEKPKTVDVTVLDQYGDPVEEGTTVTASTEDDAVSVEDGTTDEDGVAEVAITPEKPGKATVDIQVGNLDKQTVTINVTEADTPVNYEISNSGDDLVYDIKQDDDGNDELAFEVYGVDKNGNATSKDPIENVNFVVKDDEGEEVGTETGSEFDVENDFDNNKLETGKYTLEASKNDFDYGSVDFEVVDSTPSLDKVDPGNKSLNFEGHKQDLVDFLNSEADLTLYDQKGEKLETQKLEEEDIVSVNSSNDDVLGTFENNNTYRLAGHTAGEVTLNVRFDTDDDNPQTVSFNVKNTVDTSKEFDTALENAESGDTITLDGDINGPVTVDKGDVIIDGQDKYTIDGNTTIRINPHILDI